MKDKVTKKANEAYNTTKAVVVGAENLMLAASISVCAIYNAIDVMSREVSPFEFYTRITASVIVILMGGAAIVKIFKAIGERN